MIRIVTKVVDHRKCGSLQSSWHITSVYVLFVLVYRKSVLLKGVA
jgi:hypothetical protein